MHFVPEYLAGLTILELEDHYGWAHSQAEWHAHVGRHALARAYDRIASDALQEAITRQIEHWAAAADQAQQDRLF